MVRKDGAEARKERISLIARTIQSALFQAKEVGYISLSGTISKIMVETGLTRGKVEEYLQLLSEQGQFEVNVNDNQIKRTSE